MTCTLAECFQELVLHPSITFAKGMNEVQITKDTCSANRKLFCRLALRMSSRL